MKTQNNYRALGCSECSAGAGLDFDFSMAFQPIVNTATQEIFAHEALVRGPNNEGAPFVFEHVNDSNRYRFDQVCRVKAIKLAAELGMTTSLSINFMPNAVYRPELCIRTTLAAAETYGFPIERIIFEFAESERVDDFEHVRNIVMHYRSRGMKVAIDDFGAGYAGLTMLAGLPADIIKIDMGLIRDIERDRIRQAIVKGIVGVCAELSRTLIAEGIESRAELETLQSFGIQLFQGYYFARPAFESLATIPPEAYISA